MAKPLEFTPRTPTPQEQLHAEVADSTEALLAGLHLLRQLHEHGVLDVAQKTVRGGEGLTASLLHILGGQSSTTLIRNVTELGKTLSELDPGEVSVLGHAVTVGVHEGARHVAAGKGIGLGELLSLLKDRDVQVALGAIFALLKGAGRALREANEAVPQTANQAEVGR
ncbi:helical membrane plugin domain-containing protein [Deinococcus sp. PEB2-63]